MKSLERVISAFDHIEADRVPIFGDTIDSLEIVKYFNGPKLLGESLTSILKLGRLIIGWKKIFGWIYKKMTPIRKNFFIKIYQFYERMGTDLTYFPANPPLFIKILDKETIVSDWGAILKANTLPGDLTTFYYIGGYWKAKEDYENWEIPKPDDPKVNQVINGYKKVCNDDSTIVKFPIFGEIFGRAWNGFGMELFTKLLYKEQKFIDMVFRDIGSYIYERIKLFLELESPPPVICLADDLGEKHGTMMSPKLLRKYVFPWHKKICDLVHKNGSKIFLHSCGNIREVIPDFVKSGFDGLNPIQSTTPMDIFEIHEKFGDKITLIGNVPMPLLTGGTLKEVKEYTLRLLKELAPNGGFIMAVDHSVPPTTIPENYINGVLETTKKYGIYPINF
ncbi:MAG: uroporphyrinogen decarboxylase family protein [Candidatus Helarchaeota archaeon]